MFETNSSSTHCLVIVSEEDWKKFEDGELVLDLETGELSPTPEEFPKQNNEGKWEYEGETYEDLFDIDNGCGGWFERDSMLYAALDDDLYEAIMENVDGNVVVSIIGWEA